MNWKHINSRQQTWPDTVKIAPIYRQITAANNRGQKHTKRRAP